MGPRVNDIRTTMSPISKEKIYKQEHEEVSEMSLEKMKTKDSSPEEQTESLE